MKRIDHPEHRLFEIDEKLGTVNYCLNLLEIMQPYSISCLIIGMRT